MADIECVKSSSRWQDGAAVLSPSDGVERPSHSCQSEDVVEHTAFVFSFSLTARSCYGDANRARWFGGANVLPCYPHRVVDVLRNTSGHYKPHLFLGQPRVWEKGGKCVRYERRVY